MFALFSEDDGVEAVTGGANPWPGTEPRRCLGGFLAFPASRLRCRPKLAKRDGKCFTEGRMVSANLNHR